MVDHRRLGDVIRARKGSGGGRGAGRAHRDVWPLPSRHASRSAWGACASQPAALEAWRVLVWLITGKHGAEKREPGGLALFYNPLRLPYMSTTTLHLLYLLPTLCVRHVP